MKRMRIGMMALVFGGLGLALGCTIAHTRTVTHERDGSDTTDHSVRLNEAVSGKDKGVELYKSSDQEERPHE